MGVRKEVKCGHLNSAGCLYWEKENWFVSEALAGQRVRIERVKATIVGKLPAHVRAELGSVATAHAAAGHSAQCFQASSVALRAPYEPWKHGN